MRFLIIKTSALGDIVHCFPCLAYLKNKFPEAKIDWVAEKNALSLLRSHPLVDEVIAVDTKKWKKALFSKETLKEIRSIKKRLAQYRYDAVFDLQGNIKSAFFLSFAKSKNKVGFGRKTVAEKLNLFFTTKRFDPPKAMHITRDYLFLLQAYFQDKQSNTSSLLPLNFNDSLPIKFPKNKTHIIIFPGSRWVNKKLKLSTLCDFLKQIEESIPSYFFFGYGNEEEKKECETLSAFFPHTGETLPFLQPNALQYTISQSDLVIAMDSFPLHLAATTKTPTFSIFGPSNPFKYAPQSSNQHFYQGKCPYNIRFTKRCPYLRTCKTGACTKKIDSYLLFRDFIQWWEQKR